MKKYLQLKMVSSQFICAFLYLLPGFTGGAAISYFAAALPYYMEPSNNSTIQMTESEASWFGKLR